MNVECVKTLLIYEIFGKGHWYWPNANQVGSVFKIICKIEKVPRGIRGEKSSKDMASSRNLVSTIGALASPKWGTEPGVRKGKRSLLASHTRCICSMETTHNSVKVKLGIKVMKLVESLIGREVTVGQGSECHLTFVRGLLHIAQQDPCIDHKTSWMTISSVPQGIPVWVAYWKVAWPSE